MFPLQTFLIKGSPVYLIMTLISRSMGDADESFAVCHERLFDIQALRYKNEIRVLWNVTIIDPRDVYKVQLPNIGTFNIDVLKRYFQRVGSEVSNVDWIRVQANKCCTRPDGCKSLVSTPNIAVINSTEPFSSPVTTTLMTIKENATKSNNATDEPQTSHITIIVSIVACILIVILIMFFFIWRKRKGKELFFTHQGNILNSESHSLALTRIRDDLTIETEKDESKTVALKTEGLTYADVEFNSSMTSGKIITWKYTPCEYADIITSDIAE